jgi:phage-related baseplate assembly protein
MRVSDYAILANATSGALTVTLPHASTSGLIVDIKKIDSSAHAVMIAAASGDKIEGAATKSLSTQYSSYMLIADGVHTWYIQSNAT